MCHHGIEQGTAHFSSVVAQYQHIVFYILSYFQRSFFFESRPELINYFLRFGPIGRYRDIKCLIFGIAEAHSHEFCGDGIGSCCFCV